jgi:hypothetical protein
MTEPRSYVIGPQALASNPAWLYLADPSLPVRPPTEEEAARYQPCTRCGSGAYRREVDARGCLVCADEAACTQRQQAAQRDQEPAGDQDAADEPADVPAPAEDEPRCDCA